MNSETKIETRPQLETPPSIEAIWGYLHEHVPQQTELDLDRKVIDLAKLVVPWALVKTIPEELEMTRKQFLGLLGFGLVMPSLKKAERALNEWTKFARSHEKESVIAEAAAAEGMAWNLLMQINKLGWTNKENQKLADIIAPAFYHASKEIFREEHNYEEAKILFERLTDSMLKLGAVETLNKILKEEGLIFSWQDIRKAIDLVILTKSQPLSEFENVFLKKLKGAGVKYWQWEKLPKGQRRAWEWVWRVIPEEKEVKVRDGLGEHTGHYLTLKPGKDGEIIMAKMVKISEPSEEVWYETSVEENIPFTSTVELPGLRGVLSLVNPDTVFIPAGDLTPTYP